MHEWFDCNLIRSLYVVEVISRYVLLKELIQSVVYGLALLVYDIQHIFNLLDNSI